VHGKLRAYRVPPLSAQRRPRGRERFQHCETMCEVGEDGLGKKNRDWNRTDLLEKWRERWREHVNERLATRYRCADRSSLA